MRHNRIIIILLSLFLVCSLSINIVLFVNLNTNSDDGFRSLIGTWEDGNNELHIFSDKTVILLSWHSRGNEKPGIFNAFKGYYDDGYIIFDEDYFLRNDNNIC